jgi:SOS response regulatory protein OraA/RecX
MPTVTALRARRRRVDVELDGAAWRTLPLEVVGRAGLGVGLELDRPRLRLLRRELRRAEALAVAGRALRTRDLSAHALDERLARDVAPAAREEAVAVLTRAGVVDDRRVAENRAAAMAARGYGDAAICHDLRRRGLEPDEIAAAVASLEPEADRAAALVARRGLGTKTARYLASRGFGEDVCATALEPRFGQDS